MDTTLELYAIGGGLAIGGVIGGTAAVVVGLNAEIALLVGFGAAGGLAVGGLAGRFAGTDDDPHDWGYRVLAYTLSVGLFVGCLLGLLAAWLVDGALVDGYVGGAAAGGAFGLLLGAIVVSAGLNRRPIESASRPE